jgi:O-acetyl-ADP-ribose deacetylase (regulator of RNase III)
MNYSEERKNLFEAPIGYYLAHCIASDAAMGAGIAVQFVKQFPEIKVLRTTNNKVGSCIKIKRVLNLITKKVSSGKPTYESFTRSLEDCKKVCLTENIKLIAMPKIGCGLDGLSWGKVSEIIKEVFKDTVITIKVMHI